MNHVFFYITWNAGCVGVAYHGEQMATGCTTGRRQAGGGSVMIWAMLCWETLGAAIHVDVTLTRTIYLSIAADYVHSFNGNGIP